MRVLTVIGNRPQFVKAAAVSFRLREAASEVLVHTGQHYDAELSQVFFDELELPRPEHLLDLGGGTNTGGGYSDIDLIFTPEGNYAHKDGSPY